MNPAHQIRGVVTQATWSGKHQLVAGGAELARGQRLLAAALLSAIAIASTEQ